MKKTRRKGKAIISSLDTFRRFLLGGGTTLSQIASITFPGKETHNYLFFASSSSERENGKEFSFSRVHWRFQIIFPVTKSSKTFFPRSFVQATERRWQKISYTFLLSIETGLCLCAELYSGPVDSFILSMCTHNHNTWSMV